MHEPRFLSVEFEVVVEGRKGRLRVPDHVEMDGQPIRSPVDGAEIRAQIRLPNGFEYEVAEVGSGSSRSIDPMRLEHSSSYGQFANLHLDSHRSEEHTSDLQSLMRHSYAVFCLK